MWLDGQPQHTNVDFIVINHPTILLQHIGHSLQWVDSVIYGGFRLTRKYVILHEQQIISKILSLMEDHTLMPLVKIVTAVVVRMKLFISLSASSSRATSGEKSHRLVYNIRYGSEA